MIAKEFKFGLCDCHSHLTESDKEKYLKEYIIIQKDFKERKISNDDRLEKERELSKKYYDKYREPCITIWVDYDQISLCKKGLEEIIEELNNYSEGL